MSKQITSKDEEVRLHSANDNKVSKAFLINRLWARSQLATVLVVLVLVGVLGAVYKYTFAATTTYNRQPFGAVDYPRGGIIYPVNSVIKAQGWAVDSENVREGAIKSVEIYVDKIDGSHYYGAVNKANMKDPRPDICNIKKYSNRVGCPNIGWHFNLDTKKYHLGPGDHFFKAKIIDSDHDPHYKIISRQFKIGGSGPYKPPKIRITEVIQNILLPSINTAGEAIADDPAVTIKRVQIYVDGVVKGDAALQARLPVQTEVLWNHVGFSGLYLNLEGLSSGQHEEEVIVTDSNGSTASAVFIFNYLVPQPTGIRSLVDRPDEVTGPQVHLVYAVPNDGVDTSIDKYSKIKNNVAGMQNWLSQQTGGKQIIFDTYGGGKLDITFYRSKHTQSYYDSLDQLADRTIQYLDVYTELQSAPPGGPGFNKPNKKYAVYFASRASGYCGVTKRSLDIALVLTAGSCSIFSPAATPNEFVAQEAAMLHELFHTFGAVPDCDNPSRTLPDNRAHVKDRTDLMTGYGLGPTPTSQIKLDPNRNNYYWDKIPSDTSCAILDNTKRSPFLK